MVASGDERGFNGWENRETWALVLHLDNDRDLCEWRRQLIAETLEFRAEWLADRPGVPTGSAVGWVADAIQDWVEEMFVSLFHPWPEGEPEVPFEVRLLVQDVGSLWRVDWRAVASYFVGEHQEVSA